MEQSHPFEDFPPQKPKNPESKTLNFDEQRHKRVMGKLKDSVFTILKASNPSRPISRALKSHIAKQLHEFFPSFVIPTHPSYALMIETAIMELNEEGGSNEESISGFIEKNYEDLPWGHSTFLSHHLRKLCGTGEIVCKNDGRYMISVDQGGIEEECQVQGQENEMINEWNSVRENQVVVFEEWRQFGKKAAEASEQEVERSSVSLYDAWQINPQYQHVEVKEGPNNLQEVHFEATDKRALACLQQNQIVVFEQNIPEEEPCMELLNKKTEFQEQLMENSHCFVGMEEKKVDLEVDQQQQARTLCSKRAPDIKIGGKLLQRHEDKFFREENQPQEHHLEGETKVLGLCCVNREDLIKNLWVSLGDSSLTMLKERRKQSVKEQLQMRNIWEERKFVVICGLQAQQQPVPKIYIQQKAPKSHPDNEQQQLSQDTTMSILLSSDHQHQLQLEGLGRGRPSEIEGNGNHHGGLHIYVRRRRRA